MKTKTVFFLLIFTSMFAIGFSSCSKTEIIKDIKDVKRAIDYNVYTSKSTATKGIPTTTANLSDFSVFAFGEFRNEEIGEYMRKHLYTGDYNAANMDVVRDDNGNISAVKPQDPKDIAYWPSDNSSYIAFWAFSPSIKDENGNLRSPFKEVNSSGEYFPYSQESFNITIEDKFENQVDLLFVETYGDYNYATESYSKVELNFQHMLAQIVFKAQVMNSSLRVKINSLEITNIQLECMVGSNSVYPKDDAPKTNVHSTISDKVKEGIVMGDNATFITTDKVGFVPPFQEYSYYDPEISEFTEQTLLKLNVKLENALFDNNENISNEIYTGNIYIPFDVSYWGMGAKYVYTLKFGDADSESGGGGFDEDGNPILDGYIINYTTSVEEWQEGNKGEIDM